MAAMVEQPIAIHYQQLEEWLTDRKSVFVRRSKTEYMALIEMTPRLVQLIQYDVPALQKSMKRTESCLDECHRVCEDADRTVASMAERRKHLLEKNGLEGLDTSDDLQMAVDRRITVAGERLSGILAHYAASHLDTFKDIYETHLRTVASGRYDDDAFTKHFPWLSRLNETKLLPLRDSGGPSKVDAAAGAPQIDWGDCDDTDLLPAEVPVVTINWDTADPAVAAAPEVVDGLPRADGKHFSLDLFDGKDRTNITMELTASCCFARQRKEEGDTRFNEFLERTEEVLSTLTTSTDTEFVRMQRNFRLRETLEENINFFDRATSAAQLRKASHEHKITVVREESLLLESKQEALLSEATTLRDNCLKYLSMLFPGRKIIIAGDINKYI